MKVWLAYAGAGLVVTVVGAWIGMRLVEPAAGSAVRFAAVVAYVVQLAAFAALVAVRQRTELFLMGWASGLVLRFATIALVAVWLTRDPVYAVRPALLSLVVFVFVLLLLEPLFLRRGLQTR